MADSSPAGSGAAKPAPAGGGGGGGGAAGFDSATVQTVQKIPLLRTRAGPRDGDKWGQRLREELTALIKVR